ncbi:MAG: subtilisin-like proprotein convertase family protein [Rubritalea sp.]|jgi:subtilisin-like proprotein convertase family protein
MKIKITLIALLFSALFTAAQTVEERAQIIKSNNQVELQQLIVDLNAQYIKDQENILEYSTNNNSSIFKKNEDGSFDQLIRVNDDGTPIFYSLDNVDSGISTRADRLHNGSTLGLNIEGQGMTAYVWDGGPARVGHQEFTTTSSGGAVVGDGQVMLNGNSFHATHVSGTIAASGVDPNAKGMAPQAQIITNEWTNDTSEMASAGANGALISNHSYGIPLSSFSGFPEFVGKYVEDARIVDQITYNAPYYLPVYSAGNDGGNANGNPISAGYDKLTGDKVAKNIMTVANAQDANINTDGTLGSVSISGGSSQGPTDDLRIKPDIAGNGTQVFSSFDGSSTSYGTISGTSMASPNIAGSMLLLQQYYNQKNGSFMRAASLKGLTLHTADDAGSNGPDAVFGWGLMNTMAAANVITENKISSRIVEAVLQDGQSYSITVDSDNVSELLASISWTDPAGQVNTGGANDPTPSLVNDLDVRITQNGMSFEPWKLTGANANTTGDNIVDNFERVDVANASGAYTITVTHKGSLVNGSQAFSLIVTGEFNLYAIASTTTTLEICNDQIGVFPLEFLVSSNFSDTAVLSVSGLPSGVNSSFSVPSFTAPGNETLSLTNLNSVADGTYPIVVTAATVTETKILSLNLRIMSANFISINAIWPTDQVLGVSTSAILDWEDELNAQEYDLQMARNASFGRPFLDVTVSNSIYAMDPSLLDPASTYYWRVKPKNDCGQGVFAVYSFTTFNCNEINAAVPTPISIPDNTTNGIQSTLTVNDPNNLVIGELSVYVRSVHEYSGDLVIFLTSPSGTTTQLKTSNSCATPDLDVTFENGAAPFVCNTTSGQAGYFGSVAPVGDLSVFNGETVNGDWVLTVTDEGPTDLGTLNNWKITFCEQPATASNEDVEDVEFSIYPNPSNGQFTVESSNDTNSNDAVISVLDLNGRVVFTKEIQNASRLNETIDVQNLTNGLYLLQIQQGASRTVKKIIINK